MRTVVTMKEIKAGQVGVLSIMNEVAKLASGTVVAEHINTIKEFIENYDNSSMIQNQEIKGICKVEVNEDQVIMDINDDFMVDIIKVYEIAAKVTVSKFQVKVNMIIDKFKLFKPIVKKLVEKFKREFGFIGDTIDELVDELTDNEEISAIMTKYKNICKDEDVVPEVEDEEIDDYSLNIPVGLNSGLGKLFMAMQQDIYGDRSSSTSFDTVITIASMNYNLVFDENHNFKIYSEDGLIIEARFNTDSNIFEINYVDDALYRVLICNCKYDNLF